MSAAPGPSRLLIPAALAACAIVGVGVALDPWAFLAIPAVGAFAAVCTLAYRQPGRMLGFAMFLVLVAGTKFRNRDETASLSDTLDALVLLELGLYAVIALIVAIAVATPAFQEFRARRARPIGAMEWSLVAFTAVALLSTLWSDAPMLSLVRAGQLAVLLALGGVAIRVLGVAGLTHALGLSAVVYVLVCAAIAVAFPGTRVEGTVAQATQRFSWFALHSISAAVFTAVAILYVFCLVLFVPGGWKQRRAGLPIGLALVPLGAVMVATNSRGPLFALVGAVVAVLALRAFRPVTSLTIAAMASLAILAAAIAAVTPASVLEDVSRSDSAVSNLVLRGQDVREFGTLTGRTELWADLLPLAADRPVLGYGYQASRAVLLRLRPWAGHAHNGLLQTTLDLGTLGALLLWTPFFWALSLIVRMRPPDARATDWGRWESAAAFAILVFTLVDSVSDISLAGPPGYELLLFLCALIAAEWLARPVRAAGPAAELSGRAALAAWGAPPASRVA